jgi:hypothetical protein
MKPQKKNIATSILCDLQEEVFPSRGWSPKGSAHLTENFIIVPITMGKNGKQKCWKGKSS